MATAFHDRVRETGTGTSGAITLLGAVAQYQAFSVVGNGASCRYTVVDADGAKWGTFAGVWSTGGSLSRVTTLESSNGVGVAVTFSAGTHQVFLTPDAKALYDQATTQVLFNDAGIPAGNAGLTFDKTAVVTTTSGSILIGQTLATLGAAPPAGSLLVGDQTYTDVSYHPFVQFQKTITDNISPLFENGATYVATAADQTLGFAGYSFSTVFTGIKNYTGAEPYKNFINAVGADGRAAGGGGITVSALTDYYFATVLYSATVDTAYELYIASTYLSSATLDKKYCLWVADQTGGFTSNCYYSWFDSPGVRRVRHDSTFDSVAQAIEALYNPQFTKYTAGAANYERIAIGQWNGNVAEIWMEAGAGGSVLRNMRLGPTVQFGRPSSVTGQIALAHASSAFLTTIQAGNAAAARTYTWPVNFGAAGSTLTDAAGNGTLSWAAASSGLTVGTTAIASGTATRLLYETSGNKVGEITGATSDGTTLTLVAPVLGTPASGTLTNCTGLPAAGVVGTAAVLGANTFTGNQTLSSAALIASGNISVAAWTTNGVRTKFAAASYTDTSSSGTVAAAYTDLLGAGTILASSATTYTDYFGVYMKDPVASTNVTMTRKWSLGLAGGLVVGNGAATGGSASVPLLMFGTTTNCGFYRDSDIGANALGFTASGTASFRFQQAELNLVSNGLVSWVNQVNSFASSSVDTALKRSAAGVLRITDGGSTNLRDLNLRNVIQADANGTYHQIPGMAVANLPAAPVRGMRCYVTDSNAASYTLGIGATVAGGGATVVPVFYNGANWLIG